jgi:hypothetical protein
MERKLLSRAARVMLIQTCIASIPVYLLSFIKFPKWAIKAISSQMENSFGMTMKIDTDGT